jgi:predicted DNA-binding transcriptional regulator AlpA
VTNRQYLGDNQQLLQRRNAAPSADNRQKLVKKGTHAMTYIPLTTKRRDGAVKEKTIMSNPLVTHPANLTLPNEGYVRLPQVLAAIPVSKSSWWAGCKSGRYPAPIKLGPKTTAWRVSDIRALIAAA